MTGWRTWREATEAALYQPGGFYLRPEGPARHFRTSVQASELFATALLRLAVEVDAALGQPDRLAVVDVGAGRGELLGALARLVPDTLASRLALHGVERAARPSELPADVGWSATLPQAVVGMVIANEWLDNVPVDVAERTADGTRLVLVDSGTGTERLDGPPDPDDLDWLARWWPLDSAPIGSRAEIGRPRDETWAAAVSSLRTGLALAIDYAHTRADREAGHHAAGTLMGYQEGRAVPPVPDGSRDITSHVALDACAAAGQRSGATATLLTTQRQALSALRLSGRRPSLERATSDPVGYLRALAHAGEAAELMAGEGLGGFSWLVQTVGIPLPPALANV